MQHFLRNIAHIIDIIGVMIVCWGFTETLIIFIKKRFSKEDFFKTARLVRCKLGTYLGMALEFMIASDIIMTVIEPTRDELILIGTLVVIRTAIGYFLGKELKEVQEGGLMNGSEK